MTLHPFHARSLASTLTLADASVRRMQRLLANGGEDGLIRSITSSLSADERAVLLRDVRSLQQMLVEMASAFSLPRSDLDLRRVLDGELSGLWVLFEDCRPRRMQGYGQEFSGGDETRLENTVNHLTDWVRSIIARLDRVTEPRC